MNGRKWAQFAEHASKSLRKKLFEDSRDSARVKPDDLARQVLADVLRSGNFAAWRNTAETRLGYCDVNAWIGAPGARGEEGETLVTVRVIPKESVEILVNNASIAKVPYKLNGYDAALVAVTQAVQAAMVQASDKGGDGSTPNYGRLQRLSGPY